MSIAVVAAIIAGAGLGVTVVVLLIRGSFQLGKLVNKVDNQETRIDNLVTKVDDLENKIGDLDTKFDAKFDILTATINELRADIQQTNRILVGLANHTHDADRRTVFTIPS